MDFTDLLLSYGKMICAVLDMGLGRTYTVL